jgi:hypothetical protein
MEMETAQRTSVSDQMHFEFRFAIESTGTFRKRTMERKSDAFMNHLLVSRALAMFGESVNGEQKNNEKTFLCVYQI